MLYSRLRGQEEWSNIPKRTLVYWATHDEAGASLPHRNRSFISFNYGGRDIEDFDLIAVIKNNSMDTPIYGEFNNITTNYEGMDGQFYWGTNFTNNKLSFSLATDEITEEKLLEFKYWFKPGEVKELILSEHPNRGIKARVNTTPIYHMLPFEKPIELQYYSRIIKTSTTVYRGSIDIEFIMDDPYWYSLLNVLSIDEQIESSNDEETLKIALEDKIPIKEYISDGNIIYGQEREEIENTPKVGSAIVGYSILVINSFLTLPKNGTLYAYYGGTAPAPVKLEFSLLPLFENWYIKNPLNKIYNQITNSNNNNNYNCIIIGDKEFRFTTPSLLTGYNLALQIMDNSSGKPKTDVKLLFNEGINNYYVRQWAFEKLENSLDVITGTDITNFKTGMYAIFENCTCRFSFDSATGKAVGKFNLSGKGEITENVGDMVYNKYFFFEGRTTYEINEYVTDNNCIEISTDYPNDLSNFNMEYKHMYL